MHAENLELARKQLGEDHLYVLRIRVAQARLDTVNGNPARADAALVDLIARLRKQGPNGVAALAQAIVARGDALLAQRRTAEAIPLLTEGLHLRESYLWDQSWELAIARERLGEALGRNDPRGKELLHKALSVFESQLGPENRQTQRVRRLVGT